MIDQAIEELAKIIIHIEKNAKITSKEKNIIEKIRQILNTIQDAVVYAK